MRHHVAVTIPNSKFRASIVDTYFERLGFTPIESGRNSWVFHRGSKGAAFYRTDIRAYSTTLNVVASGVDANNTRISCDFEVWLFMNWTMVSDIATLDAEVRGLESVFYEQ